MGAFLLALVPLLAGFTQPLKDYFTYKTQIQQSKNDIELATLTANKEAVISGNLNDTNQRANYLSATSQNFKQGTYYFVAGLILYSVFFKNQAATMWHNFDLIPEWFRTLFVLMTSATWGLPIAKEHIGSMMASLSRGIADRRDYKLEKLKVQALNEKILFDSLRKTIFTKGMTQSQVSAVLDAIKAATPADSNQLTAETDNNV